MQKGGDLTSHDDENGDVFFYAKHESVCERLLDEYIAMHGLKNQLMCLPLHGLVKRGFTHVFKAIVNQGIKVTSDQGKVKLIINTSEFPNSVSITRKKFLETISDLYIYS